MGLRAVRPLLPFGWFVRGCVCSRGSGIDGLSHMLLQISESTAAATATQQTRMLEVGKQLIAHNSQWAGAEAQVGQRAQEVGSTLGQLREQWSKEQEQHSAQVKCLHHGV